MNFWLFFLNKLPLLIFYNLLKINLACLWYTRMTTYSMCGRIWKLCQFSTHCSFSISYLQNLNSFFRVVMCPVTKIHLFNSGGDHVAQFWPMNVTRSLLSRASGRAVVFLIKRNRLCAVCLLSFSLLFSCLIAAWISYATLRGGVASWNHEDVVKDARIEAQKKPDSQWHHGASILGLDSLPLSSWCQRKTNLTWLTHSWSYAFWYSNREWQDE